MNRIDQIFADLRAAGGKALMPYVTAGDPDVATTGALLPRIEQAGAKIVEIGFPFSDPVADGPVIQASMTRALDAGARVEGILQMIADRRSSVDLGIVAMVSWTIPFRIGPKRFIDQCKQAGVDGFIFPDLPVEEAGDAMSLVAEADLVASHLISPTSTIERAKKIAAMCSGFVYVLARAGITGEKAELPADLTDRLHRLREVTDMPMAVGFGVSTAEQVRQVVAAADAAIVGSAIMRRVDDHRGESQAELVEHVGAFIAELAGGLTG